MFLSDESSIDNKQNGDATLYTRRRSSIAKLAIERLVRTRERLWATTISAIVSAIPALLAGYTIGFPSFALLEFQRLSSDHQLGDLLTALFVVSEEALLWVKVNLTITVPPNQCVNLSD